MSSPVAEPTASPVASPFGPYPSPHAMPATPVFGSNPLNSNDAIFIVEVLIVICLSKALTWILAKIKQPAVIAEVISGVLLGPSVMGRIPGFTNAIFPSATVLPIFAVFADVGLIFFMNLIGLELDFTLMTSDFKRTSIISAVGIALPFLISIGSSYAIWNSIDKHYPASNGNKTIGVYILFMGVAMSITAFPVLARIVKEKQLFRAKLGTTVLATAAWGDVAAWVLLALSISLIGGSGKLDALWTFLLLVGYALIMIFPIRYLLKWLIVRKDGTTIDITPNIFAVLILGILANAWLTEYFNLHSIFGAFIFGIVLPRDNNFCIKLAEKFEDFITAFFLPLYFTASGLKTQLGLLSSGNTWGLLLLLISIAIVSKISGVTLISKFFGMTWRESFSMGVLMNTKGLIELIVLNIGLSAGLISPTTFSMMVVVALVTTFITSPIIHFLYPYDRIVEFENQTPGKTVLLMALRDRVTVAPMLGVMGMISGGRPKKYRIMAMRTQPLPDRPSAYMSNSHTDDVLDHVGDFLRIMNLKVKTIPLTYDETESQKIKQLVTTARAKNADFFFTCWRLPIDSVSVSTISSGAPIGGNTIHKIYEATQFQANLGVLIERGLSTTESKVAFVYTGSPHDHEAAKLVRAMLHSASLHVTIIYAVNKLFRSDPITNAEESKDAILNSFFIKQRAAQVELKIVQKKRLNRAVIDAIEHSGAGLVVIGTDLHWDIRTKDGINYKEIVCSTTQSFLCITRGTAASSRLDESHVELHSIRSSVDDHSNRDSVDGHSPSMASSVPPPVYGNTHRSHSPSKSHRGRNMHKVNKSSSSGSTPPKQASNGKMTPASDGSDGEQEMQDMPSRLSPDRSKTPSLEIIREGTGDSLDDSINRNSKA